MLLSQRKRMFQFQKDDGQPPYGHIQHYRALLHFSGLVCCSVRHLTSMARHSGALSKILDDRWRKIREEQRRYVSDRWKCYDGNMVTNNSKILQKITE